MITAILKGRNLVYSFLEYKPDNYDLENNWPVIIQLHGNGEGGDGTLLAMDKLYRNNTYLKQAKDGTKFPFILIAPQAPNNTQGLGNFSTANIVGVNQDGSANPVLNSSLLENIKKMYSGKIDLSRIYITGYSAGGGTAVKCLAASKEIAAVLAACPAVDDTLPLDRLKDKPLKLYHTFGDTTVPFHRSWKLEKGLYNPGGKFDLTILPGVSHDAWSTMYTTPENLSWLLAQRLPAPIIPKPEPVYDFVASEAREHIIQIAPGASVTFTGINVTFKAPEIVQKEV
jgi:predicted peptidase